ncbi:MAG: cell division protein ZapE [Paracoccus denitrificans]|nr:MAG: cell division protein ZapE [Paracoccus denitrificans]PZO85354.1 MAG: cell division protein ZapE [Paracoccus denitrificans]
MSASSLPTQSGAVTAAYDARVRAGDISDDAAQRATLPALDGLVARLGSAAPAKAAGGFLSRLFTGSAAVERTAARGLYLWGGVGRGKSMLMDLIMDAAPIAAKRRVHFHEFMQEVQAGLNRARAAGAQDAVSPVADEIAARTRLLCFDEMQITDIADAMIVGRLFQILFDKGVVVVTTSNRVPEDLYKNGLNRQLFLPFIALIRQRLEVIHLESPQDHRQGRKTGDPVWFAPDDAQAARAMETWWDALTDCAAGDPLVLSVNGRKVSLPSACGRVARASFEDLCGKPLGPADYLALANAVDTLLIEHIPQLSSQNFDRAKRFVTLIDALYEAKVRVIASAAAEPEKLYEAGEGSFEFERTASRLQEMRDAAWGSR